MPTKPIALTRKDELIVVTNNEGQGLRSITTKGRLRLKQGNYGPEVRVEREARWKDCRHFPIILLLTAPLGRTVEFRFTKQVPVSAVQHNRLFDLASFEEKLLDGMDNFYGIQRWAYDEVLKDGALSFKKHKKVVLVRYSLGTLRYYARIPCDGASLFFDGL